MLCNLSGWVMENVSFSTLKTDNVDKYDNQCSKAYDSFPLPSLIVQSSKPTYSCLLNYSHYNALESDHSKIRKLIRTNI